MTPIGKPARGHVADTADQLLAGRLTLEKYDPDPTRRHEAYVEAWQYLAGVDSLLQLGVDPARQVLRAASRYAEQRDLRHKASLPGDLDPDILAQIVEIAERNIHLSNVPILEHVNHRWSSFVVAYCQLADTGALPPGSVLAAAEDYATQVGWATS